MSREYTRAEPVINAHVALISEQLITAAALSRLIDCAARHHPNLAEQTYRLRLSRETTEATVSATVGLTHPYFFFFPPSLRLNCFVEKKANIQQQNILAALPFVYSFHQTCMDGAPSL